MLITSGCPQVIAATNRIDILDPALLRSGRLDRKIEFPQPTEEARARIMQIHSRKMNVSKDVNFEELARCTEDFNGAQLKAVCVEAGMIALRREATSLIHEDYMEGVWKAELLLRVAHPLVCSHPRSAGQEEAASQLLCVKWCLSAW